MKRHIIFVLIFLLALSIFSIDLNEPRETWDERSRYNSGLAYWFYILNGDFTQDSWSLNFAHPPIGKYLYGAVNGVYLATSVPGLLSLNYEQVSLMLDSTKNLIPGRALAAGLAALAVALTFLIGAEFLNRRVGLFAAGALMLTPLFIAHARLENLEAPLIFFFVLSVYLFLKAEKIGGNNRYWLLFGLSGGLAIATKFSAALIFLLAPIFYFVLKRREIFLLFRRKKKLITVLPLYLLLSPIIALATLFAVWPWLWSATGNLLVSLKFWNWPIEEYFLGGLTVAPFYYFFIYFLVTTPILILILALSGLRGITKERHKLVVLSWFALGIAFLSFSKIQQNGVTYIYPVFPAFALLVGIGLDKIYNRLKAIDWRLSIAIIVAIFVYLSLTVASAHPYYLDYYNEATGGPKNVYENRLFVIGEHGEGIGETISFLNSNATINSTVEAHVGPMHLVYGLRDDIQIQNPFFVRGRLSRVSEFTPDYSFHRADYVVLDNYYAWYINATFNGFLAQNNYSVVYTARAMGAPLAWVYKKT